MEQHWRRAWPANTTQSNAALALLVFLLCVGMLHAQVTSVFRSNNRSILWGTTGGNTYVRGRAGRLLDISYVGYMAGEVPINTNLPSPATPRWSVTQFTARGNGIDDDTSAFEWAIGNITANITNTPSMAGVTRVLYIPPGSYVLTKRLTITRRIALLGAGSNVTRLVFPLSLRDIYVPLGLVGSGLSNAFIFYNGQNLMDQRNILTPILGTAERGTNVITVSSTAQMAIGDWIVVGQDSPPGPDPRTYDAFRGVNRGLSRGCNDTAYCASRFGAYSLKTRVANISATQVWLERPLPFDLLPVSNYLAGQPGGPILGTTAWVNRYVYAWRPSISNIYVQGLFLDFKNMTAPVHGTAEADDPGLNGIQFSNVANSWITDIVTRNADNAISIFQSAFITVQFFRAVHQGPVPGIFAGRENSLRESGHHGIWLKQCTDVLVRNFDIRTRFTHDISVELFTMQSVVTDGRGIDLNMDHHRAESLGMVWADLDFGSATRPFASGGAVWRGNYAGAYTTYWCLQSKSTSNRTGTLTFAPLRGDAALQYGAYLNFVGMPKGMTFPAVTTSTTAEKRALSASWLVETFTDNNKVTARNLYQFMWTSRVVNGGPYRVSAVLGGVPPAAVGGVPFPVAQWKMLDVY